MDNITWNCEVCGAERADADIDVAKESLSFANGATVTVNVKYCVDKPECREGAVAKAGKTIDRWMEDDR